MITDNILPLAITLLSGWVLFEFLGLCHQHRRFNRMRDENHRSPRAWSLASDSGESLANAKKFVHQKKGDCDHEHVVQKISRW